MQKQILNYNMPVRFEVLTAVTVKIMWHVDPLTGIIHEISSYTTAVAR
jgi:hypothetical protein